ANIAGAAAPALELAELAVESTLGEERRLARRGAEVGDDHRARPGCDLGLSAALDRHVLAEHERRIGLALLDVKNGDAATDADRARGRRDGDRRSLADMAADKAHHALAGVDRELAL